MMLKGHWAYVFVTAAIAFLIAYLQGLESIVFAFYFLIYLGLAVVAILYLSWPLALPKKFVVAESSFQMLGIKPPKRS
jgi:hypothetical protein